MTTAKFASVADLEVKKATFQQLSAHCWAYIAEGDLRAAREARAELTKLLKQQKMLEFFLRKD